MILLFHTENQNKILRFGDLDIFVVVHTDLGDSRDQYF